MPYVKLARSVDLPRVAAVDGTEKAPVIRRLSKGVRESVTQDEGEPMRFALGHGYLKAVVIGKIIIGQPIDIAQVREFASKWLRSLASCTVVIDGLAGYAQSGRACGVR